MTDGVENAEARAHALLQIAGQAVPSAIESSGSLEDWNVYLSATVTRCMYLLESILALQRRRLDALILLRSLYEHVVTFAWIAEKPTERLSQWVAYDFSEKLKALNEWEAMGIVTPPSVDRAQLERYSRSQTKVGWVSFTEEALFAAPSLPRADFPAFLRPLPRV